MADADDAGMVFDPVEPENVEVRHLEAADLLALGEISLLADAMDEEEAAEQEAEATR